MACRGHVALHVVSLYLHIIVPGDVLVQVENPAIHCSVARLEIPVVGVASLTDLAPALDGIVCVSTDNRRIAHRGAEHLLATS